MVDAKTDSNEQKEKSAPIAKKRCFVACPIGAQGSLSRIHADWLLEEIIKPVFDNHFPDFEVIRADKVRAPGMIDGQIINHLYDDDLVIIDMSELNVNVFYEMGIRHTVPKPTIHMFLEGTELPFDVKPNRAIPFSVRDPQALRAARTELQAVIEETQVENFLIDNPVTKARTHLHVLKTATSAEVVLIEQASEMERRLNALERHVDFISSGTTSWGGPIPRWGGVVPPPLTQGVISFSSGGYAIAPPSATGTLTFSQDISDHQFNIGHSAAQLALQEHLVGSRVGERTYQFTLQLPVGLDPYDYVQRRVGHYDDLERIEVNGRELSRRSPQG